MGYSLWDCQESDTTERLTETPTVERGIFISTESDVSADCAADK